jgi:hypothetical protein
MRLNPTFAKPLAELNKPELALDLAHLELSCRIPVVQLIPSAYYTNHTAQGVKMAGKVKAIKIDTREARAKLEARGQPYYSEVLAGLSLGYRKGARRGVWVTRRWLGEGYVVTNIGIADDAEQADDQRILSFDQAKRRAFALASEPAKQAKTTKGRASPSWRENRALHGRRRAGRLFDLSRRQAKIWPQKPRSRQRLDHSQAWAYSPARSGQGHA